MPVKGLGDGEKLLGGRKNKTNVKTLANLLRSREKLSVRWQTFCDGKKEMGVKENK